MDKRVLEKMDALRRVVRFDEALGGDNSTGAVIDLTETLLQCGAPREHAREMADQFCEAQRLVHRATSRIIKAVDE